MGYSLISLSRIIEKKKIFKGKKIVTLGTLYPFFKIHEVKALVALGLNPNIPKELFSKHLFIDVLGAVSCHSLDVSDYQQSEIICNLNHPLPSQYRSQYDVVVDAGTLEHLSNLPVALKNIFELLKDDGIYYFGLPCNNWVDHGFFQFSPTFFIDFCDSNSKSLALIESYISTSSGSYDLLKMNPGFRKSIYNHSKKINVSGIVKKVGDSNFISFDITQTKYKFLHSNKSSVEINNISLLKKILKFCSNEISASRFIPLKLKYLIYKKIYEI